MTRVPDNNDASGIMITADDNASVLHNNKQLLDLNFEVCFYFICQNCGCMP